MPLKIPYGLITILFATLIFEVEFNVSVGKAEEIQEANKTENSEDLDARELKKPVGEDSVLYNDLNLLASEEYIYTVSKRFEALKTAPVAGSVITSNQLRSLPGRYIPQILRLFPGVDVIQVTRTEFTVDLRGFANRTAFRPRDVLVLVDNRTIYDDFSGGVEWETLDIFPEDIGKIEIVRGAGSATHGANAARGVINIITKPAEAISRFESDSTYVKDGFRQRVASGYSNADYSFKITGGYDQADLWNRFDLFTLSNERAVKTWQFNTRFSRHLSGSSDLSLGAGMKTGRMFQHTSAGTLTDNEQSVNHFQLEYEHPSISIRSFWNFRDVDVFSARTGDLSAKRSQNLYDIEFVHRILRVGNNSFTWGGDGRYNTVKGTSVGDIEQGQYTGGLFFNDLYNFTEDILFRIAGRLDYHEQAGYHFSPRAGVTYQIMPDHTLKASVNVGFRNPTLANNFFDFTTGGFDLKGNKDLKPEESIWYEAGYIGTFIPDLTFGIDIYYVVTENLIRSEFNPPTTFSFVNETEDVKGGGGEIWGQYELTQFIRVIANYSYNEYREGTLAISTAPPNKANLGVLFTGFTNFSGAVTFHFVDEASGLFGNTPGTLPEYSLLNFLLNYEFSEVASLSLEAFNILDKRHRELIPIGEEIGTDVFATLRIRI